MVKLFGLQSPKWKDSNSTAL